MKCELVKLVTNFIVVIQANCWSGADNSLYTSEDSNLFSEIAGSLDEASWSTHNQLYSVCIFTTKSQRGAVCCVVADCDDKSYTFISSFLVIFSS